MRWWEVYDSDADEVQRLQDEVQALRAKVAEVRSAIDEIQRQSPESRPLLYILRKALGDPEPDHG